VGTEHPAVERLLREPACRSPDYDVDAFNAQAVARFRDLDEPAVLQRFEKARLAQLRLVSSLPDAAFRNQPVVDRLHIEIIAHLGEHDISEQRLH